MKYPDDLQWKAPPGQHLTIEAGEPPSLGTKQEVQPPIAQRKQTTIRPARRETIRAGKPEPEPAWLDEWQQWGGDPGWDELTDAEAREIALNFYRTRIAPSTTDPANDHWARKFSDTYLPGKVQVGNAAQMFEQGHRAVAKDQLFREGPKRINEAGVKRAVEATGRKYIPEEEPPYYTPYGPLERVAEGAGATIAAMTDPGFLLPGERWGGAALGKIATLRGFENVHLLPTAQAMFRGAGGLSVGNLGNRLFAQLNQGKLDGGDLAQGFLEDATVGGTTAGILGLAPGAIRAGKNLRPDKIGPEEMRRALGEAFTEGQIKGQTAKPKSAGISLPPGAQLTGKPEGSFAGRPETPLPPKGGATGLFGDPPPGPRGTNYRQKTMDDLDSIKRAETWMQDRLGISNPLDREGTYRFSRNQRGEAGRMDRVLKKSGVQDFNQRSKTVSPPLAEALNQVAKTTPVVPGNSSHDEFLVLLAALESKEAYRAGVPVEIPEELANEAIRRYANQYREPLGKLYQNLKGAYQYAHDAGTISPEELAWYIDNPAHMLPLSDGLRAAARRHLTEGEILPLHDLGNPLEESVRKITSLIKEADENHIKRSLVELATKLGDDKNPWIRTDRPPMDLLAPKESTWRQVAYKEAGKHKTAWVDRDLAESLQHLNRPEMSVLLRFAQTFKRLIHVTATLLPDFGWRNVLRDTQEAAFYSAHGFKPFWDSFVTGMSHATGLSEKALKSNLRELFDLGGGGQATLNTASREGARTLTAGTLKTGSRRTAGQWANTLSPLRVSEDLVGIGEQATRYAEMERALNYAVKRELTDTLGRAPTKAELAAGVKQPSNRALDYATYHSRNLMDFNMRGSDPVVRAFGSVTPFFNPNIQGVRNFYDAFRASPSKATLKALALYTAPALVTWALSKDDERTVRQPRYERDSYWTLYREGHPGLVLPQPHTLGEIFAGIPTALLDYMAKKDARLGDRIKQNLLSVMPPVIPGIAIAPYQHATNRYTFSGAPVVPERTKELEPFMQYGANTPEVLKKLAWDAYKGTGGKVNLSPGLLNMYLTSYLSAPAKLALEGSDWLLEKAGKLPVAPKATAAEWPFVRTVFSSVERGSDRRVSDFYEEAHKVQSAKKTHGALKKGNRRQDAREYKKMNKGAIRAGEGINDVLEDLGKQWTKIEQIRNSPFLSADEKAQRIKQIRETIGKKAVRGMEKAKRKQRPVVIEEESPEAR